MQNFRTFVSNPLARFRVFLFFSFLGLMSCHDLHQKVYNTVHDNKDSAVKDSVKNNINTAEIRLTPDEEKDDSTFDDGSVTATWENAGIADPKRVKIFIKKLKLWSQQNNKDSIAANIKYPLLNDEKISSSTIFIKQYDKVFNDKVKKQLSDQKLSQLFRNFQGVMIGNGVIWIANISPMGNDDYKIISINYE